MRGVALMQLSQLRRAYRMASGAVEIDMPESNVKVEGVSREDPDVKIEEENQFASPARQVRHASVSFCVVGG